MAANLKNQIIDSSKILILLLIIGAINLICKDSASKLPKEYIDLKTGAAMVQIPFPRDSNSAFQTKDQINHLQTDTILLMDKYEVTNALFEEFIKETNYLTVAERDVPWTELYDGTEPTDNIDKKAIISAGSLVFNKNDSSDHPDKTLNWWEWGEGVFWKNPDGENKGIADLMQHPVVHVSWEDANAYCEWANKRLPTEKEWVIAARGGLKNKIYPWGNEDINTGKKRANFWQGLFPVHNTIEDGYEGTAPVGSYPPNNYGLYDMAGNVWEFTTNFIDPRDGRKLSPSEITSNKQYEVIIRGGSFLCSDQYCSGYRIDQKMSTSKETGALHLGFRCVKDSIIIKE